MLGALTAFLAGTAVVCFLLLKKYPWLRYDWQAFKAVAGIFATRSRHQRQNKNLYDIFEEKAAAIPSKRFLIFQDNNYSYDFVQKQMNKVSRVAYELGIRKGDVVALLMHNEPAFIWTFFGKE